MLPIFTLIIVYVVFISLGLPDAIFGVSFPAMQSDFDIPIDRAGLVAIVTTTGAMLSSFNSGKIINKLGIGKVIFTSVLLTAIGLIGMSQVPSFYWFFLCAIPLGLGAGSIDTAVNNYVALNFKSHHMPWLHSFWGVGAMLGPIILSQTLGRYASWRSGYLIIGSIQMLLTLILLFFIPYWINQKKSVSKEHSHEKNFISIVQIKGVKYTLIIFLIYVAIEYSVGLWGSSYLVGKHLFKVDYAAKFIAVYYGGITLGRFLSGFITFIMSNKQQIIVGISIIIVGALSMGVMPNNALMYIPFGLIGLGLSPIFPAMISETPKYFGSELSQHIIGYELAAANFGALTLPLFFGYMAKLISVNTFPSYLLSMMAILAFSAYRLFKTVEH